MTGWLEATVPYLKALHIAMLAIWCGGVLALPLMLARHDPALGQADYARIRRYSHFAYTLGVTPAAVLAVASGAALIFVREVFVPWMFLKLAFVGVLVAAHGWVGHNIIAVAETKGKHVPPHPAIPASLALTPIIAILFLVLAKPGFAWLEFPDWLIEPRGGQLLFDVPRR